MPLSEDVQTYFEREVLPHVSDAWIDHDKTKVGYEIPFNRHFYVFTPPRPAGGDRRRAEAGEGSDPGDDRGAERLSARRFKAGLCKASGRRHHSGDHPAHTQETSKLVSWVLRCDENDA